MVELITYSTGDLRLLRIYKCSSKANSSNGRFEDKICGHDILQLIKRFNFRCGYCNDQLKERFWQLDHFYSRAMGGKNKPENLVPTCRWCNVMKGALDGFAFIEKCKKVASKNLIENRFMIQDPGQQNPNRLK